MCGAQVTDSAVFCGACGASLPRSKGKLDWPFLFMASGIILATLVSLVFAFLYLSKNDFPFLVESVELFLGKPEAPTPTYIPLIPTRTTAWLPTPTLAILETEMPLPTWTELPRPTRTATLTIAPASGVWDPCEGYYSSRLHVGNKAYVSYEPPLSNRVRARPTTSSTILGELRPGREILVLSGPVCADDYIWWEVSTIDGASLRGWTSEGDDRNYWLIPYGTQP